MDPRRPVSRHGPVPHSLHLSTPGSSTPPMFQNLKVRVALILGLAALCVAALLMNKSRQGDIVTLGLDLKGGTYLALEIDESRAALTREQRADAIDRALKVVRIRVEGLGAVRAGGAEVRRRPHHRAAGRAAEHGERQGRDLQGGVPGVPDRPRRGHRRGPAAHRARHPGRLPQRGRRGRRAPGDGALPAEGRHADAAEAAPTATPFQSKIAGAGPEGQMLVAVKDTAAIAPLPAASRRAGGAAARHGAAVGRARGGGERRTSARCGWWSRRR